MLRPNAKTEVIALMLKPKPKQIVKPKPILELKLKLKLRNERVKKLTKRRSSKTS